MVTKYTRKPEVQIDEGSFKQIGGDHERVQIRLPIGLSGANPQVWDTRPRVVTGEIPTQPGLNQTRLEQLAVTYTAPRKGCRYRDPPEVKRAFRRARTEDTEAAWKAAQGLRRKVRDEWQQAKVFFFFAPFCHCKLKRVQVPVPTAAYAASHASRTGREAAGLRSLLPASVCQELVQSWRRASSSKLRRAAISGHRADERRVNGKLCAVPKRQAVADDLDAPRVVDRHIDVHGSQRDVAPDTRSGFLADAGDGPFEG